MYAQIEAAGMANQYGLPRVILSFDRADRWNVLRNRNSFIWTRRWSQSEVLIYFGGGYAARLYWDRFGLLKPLKKQMCAAILCANQRSLQSNKKNENS